MGAVARRLGTPLMPWQQYVADVVLEVDPGTGRLAYDEFVLTVPRQSGKSTFILSKAVHRSTATGFFGPRQSLLYTAQNRKAARKKWQEDYAFKLGQSKPWGPQVKVSLSNGNEHLRFPNGSTFGPESNTEKAGHGDTLDEAYIDEAFAQVDTRLEQAFGPAMITRLNKQLGVVSTAGWLDGSPYLLEKVTTGRELVLAGANTGTAYFEWSADEDADPGDPATWWSCMPALGLTITEEAIAAEFRKRELSDFRRAYLNQWVTKAAGEYVIHPALWASIADEASQITGQPSFGVDATPDTGGNLRHCSIAAAGARSDGRTHVEVITNRPGTGWVVAEVQRLVDEHKPRSVVIDSLGPAAPLIEPLQAAGVEVTALKSTQFTDACGSFYDDTVEDRLRHIGQPILNAALGAAKKRIVLDRWKWARKDATDISPLVAATLARWGHCEIPDPEPDWDLLVV